MKKLYILTIMMLSLGTLTASAQYGEFVGGDISILPRYEESNTTYLDQNGKKIDNVLTWLTNECGWNTFRVRLFVSPNRKLPNGDFDPTVCQDLNYVKALGKRIKDAGCRFMLDFHYSDTWVDAGNIQAPRVCQEMTPAEKAEWIYTYTKKSLQTLRDAGATPDLVQVGNEIMYGFMGIKVAPYDKSDSDWTSFLNVLKQGCNAVREVLPQSQIIIHTDRPTNSDYAKYWYGKLDAAGIDYDIIGLSYYPFWHGYLTKAQKAGNNNSLEDALNKIAVAFPTKKVQIVETAYNFQYWPSRGVNYDTRNVWDCSDEGQAKFVKDLVAELAKHSNVNGLMYWCPEEAGDGDAAEWIETAPNVWTPNDKLVMMGWLNRGLWWPTSNNGHWPVKGATVQYELKKFLNPDITGINDVTITPAHNDSDVWFSLSGSRISKPARKGIYINGNKKVIIK